ncbi:hypothetical protein GCM10020369_58390 [Cryptosporangium minutisporangium]|uniref:Protein-L-isoaspartate O-methyltransferase n=2 Tax=Cryptosporangium minutisporangium TaxID=113569 RepID=A0ABP6T5S9_9ACTN
MNSATASPTPEVLRDRMVDRVVANAHAGVPGAGRVAQVMRAVPRHQFVPEASLEDAYGEGAVITKRGADGKATSCASEPGVVGMMLEQLRLRPGQRVLEIGAGTGYNAALLADLVGPGGQVTTIDVDPDVTAGARRNLDANGYQHVKVVTADGVLGDPGRAPYDRIILTVGAWDVAAAWREQLHLGGRLVVPLRWRGQTRSVALTHQGDQLRADSLKLCGFVPLVGQGGEHAVFLDDDRQVELRWDTDQPIDPEHLAGALAGDRIDVWCGVTVRGDESFDGIWLRLTATEAGTCRISADRAAVDRGLCAPAVPSLTAALAEGDSIAYLAVQRSNGSHELGARGHGPSGQAMAERLCDTIRAWGLDRDAQPGLVIYPASTPDTDLPAGMVVDKPHTRLVLIAP